MAAQITADPSSGYQPVEGGVWPAATDAQRRWYDSMATAGNTLTREQRRQIIPCVAHLNTAIDSMERGYRIERSQQGNPAAQKSVQSLYARGRTEFASCSPASATPGDVFQSGGNPSGPPSDVFQSGGTPGRTSSDVMQSGGRNPSRTPTDVMESSDKDKGNRKPPPNTDDTTGIRHKFCTLRHLAALITMRYGTGHPIATYKVVNSNSPTYLVVLSGMEWEKRGQANLAGDALIAWMRLCMIDSYRAAIIDALKSLPCGANLIIAGHSQGGVEAQTIVEEAQRLGFKVRQVISYGAPIVADKVPGTNYLHVRARDEPLQALDRRFAFTFTKDPQLDPDGILLSNKGTGDLFGPNGSHNNYDKPSSGLDQVSVPRVFVKTPCYDIDLRTMQLNFNKIYPSF